MKSAEIRDKFLQYFARHGHTIVPSSPLVPANDPTLLFTNSGMVQFKDVFLGQDKRPYTRATSSQRSVRAGGKHNDLENVGYTARHHTFFEMLGNFSAIMQHVHSNYEIDLFQVLIAAAARYTGAQDLSSNSLKVIADHIRACAFLIVDGVIPSNEGRGYVLRRIIRRAIRHGYKLGQQQPFFHKLVADLAIVMGEAYPELVAAQESVTAVLRQEEERFAETLENGMVVLEAALHQEACMLDGETVFRLYDTYGFPMDLTADIARERGVAVDLAGFEHAMEQQREQARAASRFTAQGTVEYCGEATQFLGYDALHLEGRIVALYHNGVAVPSLEAGQSGVVVLDRTPFYAESGGQVGDRGELATSHGTFVVEDTQKIQAGVFGHRGQVKTGRINVGDAADAHVDSGARQSAAWNHSATHLLHAALRTVLGHHVTQKGSLVDQYKTRFDFSHDKPVAEAELRAIEDLVNQEIRRNHGVEVRIMKYDDAVKKGAMALFGEKYGDEVRVVGMGDFSTELCGGTHVHRSGDIGLFRIVGESGVASGVRRIEAVTGEGALQWTHREQDQLAAVAERLKAQPQEIVAKLSQVLDNVRTLERELDRLKAKMAVSESADLINRAIQFTPAVQLLSVRLPGADAKTLRETLDALKGRLSSAVIVLGSDTEGKVSLIAGVTPNLTARLKAGELVNFVAQQVGGKGGGRPDMAQAGGTDPAALPQALASVAAWVRERL